SGRRRSGPWSKFEEGDPGDAGAGAEADACAGGRHLAAAEQGGAGVAAWRGCLGDHVVAAGLEDEVEVAIRFGSDEDDGGGDGEDVPLERQPGRRVDRRRARNEEVIVVVRAGSSAGLSWSVFTGHCSTPQAPV